ncbi:MAG: hypothetical protein J0L53_13060 [Spirochaetes bacterium]|nr:hypothetical protein [Spirochaetota bacterium]
MSETETDQKLQFEKAEFEGTKTTAKCSICHNPLSGSYFTVNMQSTCPSCADNLRQHFQKPSSVGEFLKSIVFGIGAGIIGSLIYYAILRFTGYEIGLVAILVGYLVGRAVMMGSGNKGGLKFRIIAVLITYLSIVSTYVPMLIEGMRQHQNAAVQPAHDGVAPRSAAAPVPVTQGAKPLSPQQRPKPEAKLSAPTHKPNAAEPAPTLGEALFGLLMFGGIILALPFLAGIENIIGLMIIAFALFEAARRTAKPKLEISGPFTISEPGANAAV